MKFIVSCIVSLVLFSGIAVHADKPLSSDDIVILWNNAAMNAAQNNNSGTLLMVRALAIMHTAMFDAWAQYDLAAEPTLRTLSLAGPHLSARSRTSKKPSATLHTERLSTFFRPTPRSLIS